MMLLIGFLARSHYWSQDIIKPTYAIGAKLDQFAFNKLDQFAFNKLDKKQKAELLGKFIKKINESESLKNALNNIPESENVANISSDIEYKYSDYLKMYDFIDGNKEVGFSSSPSVSPR